MKNQSTNQNKPVRLYTEKHVENLDTIFKDLFQDDVLADVTFHCKDGNVKAHKAILATSSAYFRKVFYEHKQSEAVYLMYGISVRQMRSLVELIYRGTTEVPSEIMSSLFEMVDEMGVKGIVCENQNSGAVVGSPIHNRDTRYRGTKRVAVSFDGLENHPKRTVERRLSSNSNSTTATDRSIRRTVSSSELSEMSVGSTIQSSENNTGQGIPSQQQSTPQISSTFSLLQPKIEPQDGENDRIETTIEQEMNQIAKKTSWQLKQRKFKCQLCTASFKRASHLSRHQLVHTGERPWPCTYCEKAFSRHDKLKNHIRKNHEGVPVTEDSDVMVDVDDSLYTIGHVQFLRPSANGTLDSFEDDEEPSNKVTREDLEPPRLSVVEPTANIEPATPKFQPPRKEVLPPPPSVSNEEQKWIGDAVTSTQKKGRGRPRKYPPGGFPPKQVGLSSVKKRPYSRRLSLEPPLLEPVFLDNELLNCEQATDYHDKKRQLQNCKQNEVSTSQMKRKPGRPRKIPVKVEHQYYETVAPGNNSSIVQKQGDRRKKSRRGAHLRRNPTIMPNLVAQNQEVDQSDRFEVLEKEKTRGRPKKFPPVILTLKRKYEQNIDHIINIDESTTSSSSTGSNWSEKTNQGRKRKSTRNLTKENRTETTINSNKDRGGSKMPTYKIKRQYIKRKDKLNGNDIRVKRKYTRRIDNNNVQGPVIKRKYTKKAERWNKQIKTNNINEIKLKRKYTKKADRWKKRQTTAANISNNTIKRKYTKKSERWNVGWRKHKTKKNTNDSANIVQSPKAPDYRLKRKYTKRAETSTYHEQTPRLEQDINLHYYDGSSNSIVADLSPVPIKRGRGRPPKNPAVPKPLFKRPRGRPRLGSGQIGRLTQYANEQRSGVNILPKPGRSNCGNYDITNMPFGDFESLMSAAGDTFMEPYVEIKTETLDQIRTANREDQEFTDASESNHPQTKTDDSPTNKSNEKKASSFLETIGLSAVNPVGQIGQCTISFTGASGCASDD